MSHNTKQYNWLFLIIPQDCNTIIPADLVKCSVVPGFVETNNKKQLPSQRSCRGQTRIIPSHYEDIERFGDFPRQLRKLVSEFGTRTFQCVGTLNPGHSLDTKEHCSMSVRLRCRYSRTAVGWDSVHVS